MIYIKEFSLIILGLCFQFGLFDVPADIGMDNDDDDDGNDSDLETELAAITSGGGKSRAKPKPKPKNLVDANELDKMVAESLRDIGSDEELSGDDDDPNLLNELSEIAGLDGSDETPLVDTSTSANVSPSKSNTPESPQKDDVIIPTTTLNTADLLKSRIQMYKQAEGIAKAANETSRAKRFGRGLKTLETLLKQVNAGQTINPDDIPPEVFVKPATPPDQPSEAGGPTKTTPSPPIPSIPENSVSTQEPVEIPPSSPPVPLSPAPTSPTTAGVNAEKIPILLARQKEYKEFALNAKRAGDKQSALQYIKIVKLFDQVLAAARAGELVDLSDMPPPPSELSMADLNPQPPPAVTVAPEPPSPHKEEAATQASTEPAQEEGLVTASNILEALTQRLEVFQAALQSAKDQGNSSKARRSERIVKQFQDAIKQYKAGKSVAYDELPTPPGFGPIPLPSAAAAGGTSRPAPAVPVRPAPAPAPEKSSSPPASKPSPEKSSPPSRPPLEKQDSRVGGNHSNTSVMKKTIDTLLERQNEFKSAALAAKKAGEMEQAKEYLKIFKGFDTMLNAARGGLPVDLSSVNNYSNNIKCVPKNLRINKTFIFLYAASNIAVTTPIVRKLIYRR